MGWLRTIVHVLLLRPFAKLFFGLNVIGRENVQQLNQYILIANHNSHLDVLLLFCLLPIRDIARTHPVAAREYFSSSRFVFHLVQFLFDPVWVVRGRPPADRDPLGDFKQKLGEGGNLIVFPEGTRGEPGELQPFKSGIGRLAAQVPDVPVVPVFLTGPERALPKASYLLLPFCNHLIAGPAQICHGQHRDVTRALNDTMRQLSQTEIAQRHMRRAPAPRTVRSIAILGIDGSGKSTLSKNVAVALSDETKVCRISDELELYADRRMCDMQPLLTERLRELIGSYAKKAKSLKLYKIPKVAELLLRDRLTALARRWNFASLIVLDGSPLLNAIAWSALYLEEPFDGETCLKTIDVLSGNVERVAKDDPIYTRFPDLRLLQKLKMNRLHAPDVVVLLDISPGAACRRIAARGERRQVHETEEKLAGLRAAYLQVCDALAKDRRLPVCKLDGEKSPEEIQSECLQFIRTALEEREAAHDTPH